MLNDALNDTALRRQFSVCREVLDELATRLTGEDLLRELAAVAGASERDFEQLSSGVFWFALAASLDRRENGLPATPFDEQLDLPLPLRVRLTVCGSLVLRLYVALVYMREGVLRDLIRDGCRAGSPCCGRVNKLLDCDYVRRIRNALSHGSFSACVAGIVFRDDRGVVVGTPRFLSWLATWLMLIQLQALSALSRRSDRAH